MTRRRQLLRAIGAGGLSLVTGCMDSGSNGANQIEKTPLTSTRPAPTTRTETRTERRDTTDVETTDEPTEETATERPPTEDTAFIASEDVRTGSITLRKLPYEQWPRGDTGWCDSSASEVSALANVSLQSENDSDSYDPLNTAKVLNDVVRCYSAEGKEGYRKKADRMLDKLLETSVRRAGAIYVSYTFYYEWHGEFPLVPPIYSGMAQGVLLSPLSRLYRLTDEQRYEDLARLVFRSFDRPRGALASEYADEPWTTTIDDDRYYWIEGVPLTPPGHILNEMNAAIEGLYEYWRVFETPQSELLLTAALKTVKDHTDDYRVPDELSWYCLGHDVRVPPRYHDLHIRQFENFYQMTGDQAFQRAAARYKRDQKRAGVTTTDGQ